MNYTCPVCFYNQLDEPAAEYNICPCCGTEFENDDQERSHDQLRADWIAGGAKWFFKIPPPFWSPRNQLEAGLERQKEALEGKRS